MHLQTLTYVDEMGFNTYTPWLRARVSTSFRKLVRLLLLA